MKIGIFGGTFDPPHLGHELFLKTFINRYKPDKTFVVPTRIPPHKACESTSAERRLKMARIAFGDYAEISDCEIRRRGKSYTSDTLAYFKKRFPEADLYFLVGSDMLLTMDSWHEPEKIFSLAAIVSSPRENDEKLLAAMKEKAAALKENYGAKIEIMELSPVEVSSTAIRGGAEGVSEKIAAYIEKNGLYKESEQIKAIKKELSSSLSARRYYHSLGVMNTAGELAARYGADVEKARLAGLIHDCTKEYTREEHMAVIKRENIIIPDDEIGVDKLLHSHTGAAEARRRFGIEDEEILDAIRCHTAGKANMTLFEKILFIADFIDPSREYRGVENLRKTAFRDIDAAMLECTSYSVKDLAARRKTIALNTVYAYNEAAALMAKKKAERSERSKK
ncbi:MAG: nicotinate (nicotinamide) nucleotide adenylyltransferase [Clostridia bacterium]|nr:nicotinate (nicotinamide) nucleotide adenylyltransferase [Clostridia bacterium]